MSRISSTAEKKLGSGVVRLNTAVRSIEPKGSGWSVSAVENNSERRFEADHLVLAVPSPAAAPWLEPLSRELAIELRAIRYASVAVLALGYRRQDIAHPLDGFGALVPRAENLRPLGVLFDSTVFPGRAPDGHVLLRLMIGGRHDPAAMNLSGGALSSLGEEFVGQLLGARGRPVFSKIYRWPEAIAQYESGHLERIALIEREAEKFPTLHLCGASYRGVSTPLVVKDGWSAARKILEKV